MAPRVGEDLSDQRHGYLLRYWLLRPVIGLAASVAALAGLGAGSRGAIISPRSIKPPPVSN